MTSFARCVMISGLLIGQFAPAAWSQELGSVSGTFVLKGEIPKLPPLVETDEPSPRLKIPKEITVPDESVVVDPDSKGVANIFVWIRGFDSDKIPMQFAEPPEKPVEIIATNYRFKPHALVARAGQSLVVRNRNPTAITVHAKYEPFNVLLKPADGLFKTQLATPQVHPDDLPLPYTSDIHAWMQVHVQVLDHPFGAVSDAKGRFEIKGIPPGTYELKIWHETQGYLKQLGVDRVTIKPGQATKLGTMKVVLSPRRND